VQGEETRYSDRRQALSVQTCRDLAQRVSGSVHGRPLWGMQPAGWWQRADRQRGSNPSRLRIMPRQRGPRQARLRAYCAVSVGLCGIVTGALAAPVGRHKKGALRPLARRCCAGRAGLIPL